MFHKWINQKTFMYKHTKKTPQKHSRVMILQIYYQNSMKAAHYGTYDRYVLGDLKRTTPTENNPWTPYENQQFVPKKHKARLINTQILQCVEYECPITLQIFYHKIVEYFVLPRIVNCWWIF